MSADLGSVALNILNDTPDDTFDEEPRVTPPGRSQQSRAATAHLGDATVPGIGAIPAAVIQAMTRSFGTTMTRALIEADTGITLETCETRYRPSPKLQHFVRARDQHCRFPGCSHPATRCDLDHVIPWPQGPTAAYNLHALCRHHHRTKQAHGWTVTMTPDGVCTWTSPAGHTYVTTPGE
ncbi:HNH endonuclease signature motif containing protein [Flexivirga alba]|uniref:HNH endonuclease signature motif containing protein n=1 Tax=Flexivirga alba TaxID=702742 RepID=A0ABW2AAK4_9MICO